MKRAIIAFIVVLSYPVALTHAQLSLEECRQKAQENYPLIQRYQLIEKSKAYNLSNAGKGYLPQFSLAGKISYQSEVTQIPIKVPGVSITPLSKDQYQLSAELNQVIWDGGNIRAQKESIEAASNVELKKQEVDMYTLNERVDQLFFGILLLNEQLLQNRLLQDELQRNHGKIAAYVANGIANQADLDAVKVEQLSALQKKTELESTRNAYLEMLSVMTGTEAIPNNLRKPILPQPLAYQGKNLGISRPELSLFTSQEQQLSAQRALLQAKNLPKFGLFIQGAYGNPGLNMLKNEFSFYYMAGIRLSWNLGGLYTLKNERKQIGLTQNNIEVQKETFLFNTHLQATQERNEIEKVRKLMKEDEEIIQLRGNIKRAAEAKVANGTLSVTDLLREISNEDLAKQNKALHEMQLLMNIYQLKNTINN